MKTAELEKPITSNSPSAKPEAEKAPPPPPPPTPLEIVNARIKDAKAAGRAEGERRRRVWSKHVASEPILPVGVTVAAQVTLQMEHVSEGHRLRASIQNFSPQAFESSLLDVIQNKGILEAALRQLCDQYTAVLKSKAATPAITAPKAKTGIVGKIESALNIEFGAPKEEMAWPPPRPPVVGGPWGVDVPVNVVTQLSNVEKAIASFPVETSYEHVVGELNSCAGAISALSPKAKAPELAPFRYTFTPKHG